MLLEIAQFLGVLWMVAVALLILFVLVAMAAEQRREWLRERQFQRDLDKFRHPASRHFRVISDVDVRR